MLFKLNCDFDVLGLHVECLLKPFSVLLGLHRAVVQPLATPIKIVLSSS